MLVDDTAASRFLGQGAVHVPAAAFIGISQPVLADAEVPHGHLAEVGDGDVHFRAVHDRGVPDLGDPGRSVRMEFRADVHVPEGLSMNDESAGEDRQHGKEKFPHCLNDGIVLLGFVFG